MYHPACNSGVPVRVWVVWSDVPISLVPWIVGSDPKPKKDENRPVLVHVGAPSVCLGLPCKVINQSIVGVLPLSETT
jgi:hypothetical protein